MKKQISILIIFLFSISIVNALDQPNEKVKVLPNQKFMYFIQTKITEPLSLLTTFDITKLRFNKEKLIQKRLELIEYRRAEMEEMLQWENYLTKIEKLREKQLAKIEKEEIFLSKKDRVDLEFILSKHIERLQLVLEKSPESAKSGLTNAINKSSKVLDKLKAKNLSEDASRFLNIEGEI